MSNDMTAGEQRLRDNGHHGLGRLLREFPWIHLGLGLLGNLLFFVGSVLFFWEGTKIAGVWLFVFGSLGMLVGSIGQLLVKIEERAPTR